MQKYNKAIVALVMATIGVANAVFNTGWAVDETAVTVLVGAVTPILVYAIPNRG